MVGIVSSNFPLYENSAAFNSKVYFNDINKLYTLTVCLRLKVYKKIGYKP